MVSPMARSGSVGSPWIIPVSATLLTVVTFTSVGASTVTSAVSEAIEPRVCPATNTGVLS